MTAKKTRSRREPTKVFEQDERRERPALHLLYVKTAVKHLHTLERMLQELSDCANLNMLDATQALLRERDKLIQTNAAYADGAEILRSVIGPLFGDAREEGE